MRFCPMCGAPAAAGSTICPVCKSDLLSTEQHEHDLTAEEVGVPQALLAPGAGLEWWERMMAHAGRRRQARVALTVLAVALLLAVNVLAWQSFVHGTWGARLSTFHQILFVGSEDDPGAYTRSNTATQLYAMRADGSGLHRLTNPATGGYFSPAWSPDGTHLAAFRTHNSSIATLVIMRADGTDLREVPSVILSLTSFQLGNGVVDGPLTKLIAWSPDGSQLIAPTSQDTYVLLDADGTHPHPIDGDRPTWAPDGRHIAYYALPRGGPIFNADFFPVQLTGGSLVILDTRTFQRQEFTAIPDLSVGALAWSPDGRYLAATTWRMDTQQNQPVGGVAIVRPDGSDVHAVIQWAGGEADQLSWSPDGRQLAVMVEQSLPLDQYGDIDFTGPADPQLWVVNSDSSNPRNLGKCDTDQPTWAPDGQHLLVVRYNFANSANSLSQMLLVDASAPGADAQVLMAANQRVSGTELRYVFAPSWSPV
jgi:Tol biopolymer transport system component